jgi:APA family basic amino acid/polyamine antiporter
MGTFGLAAVIVNITIGGGIFRLPANVAGSLGAAAPVAYLVCALVMGLIVLCIADAGSRVSLTGGPYAYVGTAFGPYAGFISGLLLWMLGTFACAAVSTVFAGSVGLLVPALSGPAMNAVVLVGAYAFWTFINVRGVGLAARLNGVATVAKLLPLVLLAVAGLFFINTDNLVWTAAPAAGDVARTSLLLIFAFAGIECALQVVSQGILGPGLAQATASPLADAANASFGGWARTMLLVGASVSMFGHLGGMTFAAPRMVFAFARDGFLPSRFAAVHPRFHSPAASVIAQSTITLALALSGTFERLALLANVSALVLYLGCAVASWKLRSSGITTEGQTPFRVPFASVLPWVTCLVIAWLLTGLAQQEWIAFGACVAIGSLLYVARSKR